MKLLIEEVYHGGGIVCDSKGENIIFDTIEFAEHYIKISHPEWVKYQEKEEKNQSFVIYDKKNPSKNLKRLDFRY